MDSILRLRRQYNGEWLAIHVLKESGSGPEEGELLYHVKDVQELWGKLAGDSRRIYVTYAGPALEEGYAAAFQCT